MSPPPGQQIWLPRSNKIEALGQDETWFGCQGTEPPADDPHARTSVTTPEVPCTGPLHSGVHGKDTSRYSAEEEEWMKAVQEKFAVIAGADGLISFEEFKQAIGVKEDFFARRYFEFFDTDGSGEIQLEEFMQSLRDLSKQTDIGKLRFLFRIFDTDGDGIITLEELKVVLSACVCESSLRMSDGQLDRLVAALFKAADVNKDGTLSFEELQLQFEKKPALVDNLAINPANWFKLNRQPHRPSLLSNTKKTVSNLIKNKKPLLAFLVFNVMVTAACLVAAAVKYQAHNGWFIVARISGLQLNYYGMALAFSMARRTLTVLRNTRLGPYLPVDDHVEVHKMLGVTTVVLGTVHTVCHLVNIGVQPSVTGRITYWQHLFTNMSGVGFIYGTAYPTGVVLFAILVVIGICSLPVIRNSGRFVLFYWSHLLYHLFWPMLLLHAPTFYVWFVVPGLLLVAERVYTLITCCRSSNCFYTIEANLLPSKVINLVISRPDSFRFHAGDYVFIRIPSVSRWEWHPFSISSAPEQQGVMSVHIRALGNWTKALLAMYETGRYLNTMLRFDDEKGSRSETLHARWVSSAHGTEPIYRALSDHRKVDVDGPYGSAAVRLGDTDHAVIIAAGIGVTPFASVLQSLLAQHQRTRAAGGATGGGLPNYACSKTLKKIDFIWVNRHANDFEWFITLLTQLELEEKRQGSFDSFLDIHLYMTAAKTASDLKGVGLQMALDLVHQEVGEDMITGLRTRTQAGRPSWTQVFQKVKTENHGKVTVYFCGSPSLARVVERECDNFQFLFSHSF